MTDVSDAAQNDRRTRWDDRNQVCTVPCSPVPGDRVLADATERLGPVEYWTCPKHGSHSGQRRMFSWHAGHQALGLWEWTNVT